jgi:hypothetical protein
MEQDKSTFDSVKALNKRIIPVLYRRLYDKGLMPVEIIRLTKDILNIIGHGGFYNAGILNRRLERLGWEKNIVDNYIFELILYYFEYEGAYQIEAKLDMTSSFVNYKKASRKFS